VSRKGVYVLKFTPAVGNERHRARYYVGWTRNLDKRLKQHRGGRGSAISRAAVKQGCEIEVVLFIPNAGRDMERVIKQSKNVRRWIATYRRAVDQQEDFADDRGA